MITRSKSRKNKNTQNNTHEVDNNMNTETTSHGNEMDFDINNQLGNSQTIAHISMANEESGTRGPNEENAETQKITLFHWEKNTSHKRLG